MSEIIFNGDFSLIDTTSGIPAGWTWAQGDAGSTTVEQDTVFGRVQNVMVLNRREPEGGGAGITQRVTIRHQAGRTRQHPSTLVEFPSLLAVTLTHKMTGIEHAGVANFLGASYSFYYNDYLLEGLNLTTGPGGGARNDYYGGWGPAGAIGGQGATGGVGSTDGYVTQTHLVPMTPHRVMYCDFNFVLHDGDVIGDWRIARASVTPAGA